MYILLMISLNHNLSSGSRADDTKNKYLKIRCKAWQVFCVPSVKPKQHWMPVPATNVLNEARLTAYAYAKLCL